MTTRTYRGTEMSQVLNEIKQNHGEDAIILSTKELGQKLIEVCVGIEEERQAQNAEAQSELSAREELQVLERKEPSPRLEWKVLCSLLRDQGVCTPLLNQICAPLDGAKLKAAKLAGALASGMSRVLDIESRLPGRTRAVAFIGATGVGKTTTIAKLAARMRMAFDMKIALIGADCYRVGAGFHLQSYASLIKIPFRPLDPRFDISSQLGKALDAFKDCDLVLIDTAGFSPRNKDQMQLLSRQLQPFQEVERMLVLPAPSNTRDIYACVDGFGSVGFDRIVISKIDETGYLGPALNGVYRAAKPIGFLTTGQRVPEDIEPASYKRLAWMLKRTLH